ncbi:uncharacterized protein LOC127531520 isoform X1 [Acanthochromis polyacanthus]|uniref:uncharacterized protein LOC127531520 isoform X1 n=2 Tax=Acanthochromis polyacanthus TaxID=80966 RepID=UPI002234A21B|nr:uncharacterized protein LOC127531520 isoform X1 [Acanthochromis polyacanthus]
MSEFTQLLCTTSAYFGELKRVFNEPAFVKGSEKCFGFHSRKRAGFLIPVLMFSVSTKPQMEPCHFVQNKLAEWDLSELIQTFEEEGIDKETFLSLEESGSINVLIPQIGPRVKFRKRLREYLQALGTRDDETPEMMETNSETEFSTEMDPPVFLWNLESTSAPDTESGIEMGEEPVYPGAAATRGQGLLATIMFILRHRLTAAGRRSLLALLNFLVPTLAAEYPFDKIPGMSAVFYCQNCQNYMGKIPESVCSHCGMLFDKASSLRSGNFFLFSSLKDLLKDTLKTHGTKLLAKTVKRGHDIEDVMDGMMYQNLLEHGTLAADDITLLWNCDEVPIFTSPQYSIWPLQFTINELPYTQRKDTVIVAGLWLGKDKPKMNTFLRPFTDECCGLAQHPFQWTDSSGSAHSSKVFCLVCSSDAVARPLLRNCKQFNGEYGCDWCLHPGVVVEKGGGTTRSYPYDEMKQAARSKEMFEENARQAERSDDTQNGVKGRSLLSNLPLFDIVLGFVPDYMHSVLVGVCKQLVCLWLDEVNATKVWYVGQHISQMDSRLLSLKPPLEIGRSSRSLRCYKSWKASEWRAFLLFYGVSVLPGILQPRFLEHFFYLSFSIHRLLQESVSQRDLQLAHQHLVHFVKNMKELYGEENVSFNCHQLIHLSESVCNWGPLWATSAFTFERNNGNLRALLDDSDYNPRHIYQRFAWWQHIPAHLHSLVFNQHADFAELLAKLSPLNDDSGSYKPLGESRRLDITGSVTQAVEELLNQPVVLKSVEAFDSFTYGNAVYHSTSSKESHGADAGVKLKGGCCGDVQLMFLFKENCVCTSSCLCQAVPIVVVQLYYVKPAALFSNTSPHGALETTFVRVERTNRHKAFFLGDIQCKCMNVDGWLVPLPNTYERY